MKNYVNKHVKHWRDILMILTALLVSVSLVLIAYTAAQSKQHIDCIVKDLATPLPENAKSRVIVNPLTSCGIKFTQ